jgi:DNA-binding CsgD family transcriptional regulator
MEGDVGGFVIPFTIGIARGAGVEPNVCIAGTSWRLEHEKAVPRRTTWHDLTIAFANLGRALPEGEDFEDAFERGYVSGIPLLREVAGLVVAPDYLVRFMFQYARSLYPFVRLDVRQESTGVWTLDAEIPEGKAASIEYWRATVGMFRALPYFLGLPRAEVTATYDARKGNFRIVLPGSATVAAKLRRLVGRVGSVATKELEQSYEELRDAHRELGLIERLGRRIAANTGIDAVVTSVMDVLQHELGIIDVALWMWTVAPDPELLLLATAGQASRSGASTIDLEIAGRAIGRLGVGTVPTRSAATLAQVTSWIALALDNARTLDALRHEVAVRQKLERSLVDWMEAGRNALPSPNPSIDERFAARVEALSTEWSLTPRQAECLAQIARGRSNKEIAAALAIAEGTVELHVSQVLRKAKRTSRAELVAAFWSDVH